MVKLSINFWKRRRVFVTGADGLLGSWLIKALLDCQAQVTGFIQDTKRPSELYLSKDIKHIKTVRGALEDFLSLTRALHRHRPQTVFHLGAQALVTRAQANPLETFESNIRGTYNILEACRRQKGVIQEIVVASSDKAYGIHTSLPYREQMPLEGCFPYDVSKSCTDMLARAYQRSYDLPVVVMRCGNIYGGGDFNFDRIVPGVVRSLLKRQRPVIRSDGKSVRDYVYVKDVGLAYMLAAQQLRVSKLAGHALNISNEVPVSVMDIYKQIAVLMGASAIKPVILNKARCEIPKQYLSAAKIRRLLHWQPSYNLADGLRETIEWYRAALHR